MRQPLVSISAGAVVLFEREALLLAHERGAQHQRLVDLPAVEEVGRTSESRREGVLDVRGIGRLVAWR